MNEAKPILIVGADSIIGNALSNALETSGLVVFSTTRRKQNAGSQRKFFLDLADPHANDFPKHFLDNCRGGTAFILAAETSNAACADNPRHSHSVNVLGTEFIGRTLIESGMKVVFLSTNLVFDGSLPHRNADDLPCPQTEYGKQKAEAEKALLSLSSETVIVRMAKIFHKDHVLLKSWVESLRKDQKIYPFADMVVAPVSLNHVVSVLTDLIDAQVSGILQVSGPEDLTYADIARCLAMRLGAAMELVQPVNSNGQQGILPTFTTLDTSRVEEVLGHSSAHDVWSFLDHFLESHAETLSAR